MSSLGKAIDNDQLEIAADFFSSLHGVGVPQKQASTICIRALPETPESLAYRLNRGIVYKKWASMTGLGRQLKSRWIFIP
jgi:hypothetical protein